MQEYATCPRCGTLLEYVETLERDYRPTSFTEQGFKFRVDLENRWCPSCDKGFDVEAYYLHPPVRFGSIKEWED